MAGRLKHLLRFTCLLGCGGASLVWAQLVDPTRPPAGIEQANANPSAAAISSASGLQSVILKKTGKPAALINGEVVELGGRVGEARLVKIGEDAVVLRGPMGDETLRLMPAVEKKARKVGAGKTAAHETKSMKKGAGQ
jgi:MSHA biogenesis protein MshK